MKATEWGHDPDLQLRGPRLRQQHGPDHHHDGERRVRRARAVSHQHEVSGLNFRKHRRHHQKRASDGG